MNVHPTAIVEHGASIGTETQIWHFCHIMPRAIIGNSCSLGQNVFVANGVRLGNNVKVQNNVSLYEGVSCEVDVFFRSLYGFTNISNPQSAINRQNQYSSTIAQRGAAIGANATLICGITIGEYAFVGGGSVVTRDVSPHALEADNPAQ